MTEYLVVIEHEGSAWGAYCPDLPGVGVTGSSRNEVKRLIAEVVPLHVESLREAGDLVPEPTAEAAALVEA